MYHIVSYWIHDCNILPQRVIHLPHRVIHLPQRVIHLPQRVIHLPRPSGLYTYPDPAVGVSPRENFTHTRSFLFVAKTPLISTSAAGKGISISKRTPF